VPARRCPRLARNAGKPTGSNIGKIEEFGNRISGSRDYQTYKITISQTFPLYNISVDIFRLLVKVAGVRGTRVAQDR
jgi:hypothetical protein